MVSLWVMNPTKTDKRHFFILENSNDVETASRALVSLGLRMSNNDSSTYMNEAVQIRIQEAQDDSNESYIGGYIIPHGPMIKRITRSLFVMKTFGYLFYGGLGAYAIQWGLAFIFYFLGLFELIDILGYTFVFSFLVGMLGMFLIIPTGLYIDYISARFNATVVAELFPRLISSFNHFFPDITVQTITIKTGVNSRDIWKRLPSEFKEKINILDFGKINEFYWSEVAN